MTEIDTTAVIVSTDEGHHLRHSLPAAIAQDGIEVLVVDNVSTDATAELVREHGARHLRLRRRVSWTAANNLGIAACRRELVLILNPDCFLAPGFLAAARPRLAERGVGSVAAKLIRTLSADPVDRLDAIDAVGLTVDRRRKNGLAGHGRPSLAYDTPGEAFGADGAAALYRRETLQHCALGDEVFDEDLVVWTGETDLAWRARRLGWRCVYEPRAVAHHIRSYRPGGREQMTAEARRIQFRNRYLLMAKNDSPAALARDLHHLAGYEALALGHALLRERALLRGYAEAARLLPRALRRRRALRDRVVVPRAPIGLEPRP